MIFNCEKLDPTILGRVLTAALVTTQAVTDIEMSPVVEGTDGCFVVGDWPVLRATIDEHS